MFITICYSRPVQPTARMHFFAQLDILFAHLDFYKKKPGPVLSPHKTSQKIWTIIAHSRFFAKFFAHLAKRLDTPVL